LRTRLWNGGILVVKSFDSFMQRIIIIVFLVFSCFDVSAQSPFGINFQAVARDIQGNELPNDDLHVKLDIIQNNLGGDTIYSETHSLVTNNFGLFSLVIGQGDTDLGDFSSINWGSDIFFLATSISDSGVSGMFSPISTSQLISVPYALHANTVTNADDADADPGNEVNLALDFDDLSNVLSITDLEGVLSADLSSLNDEDANPENEIITEATLDGSDLQITEAGTTHTIPLGPILPSNFWLENGDGALYYTGNQTVGIGESNSNTNSTLDINGSISYGTEFHTANLVEPSEISSHFLIDNSGATITIDLPSSNLTAGREYVFIFKNSVNHQINFTTVDGSNINNQSTFTFSPAQGKQVHKVMSFGFQGWFFTSGL